MKIKHLFGLAVIAAMTASCSSNEDLGTAGPGTGTNEAGVGYATFTINLPSVNGSRAAGDPTFDKGDANEYKVNDATLLIFKKNATGKYQFKESVDLGNMEPWTSSSTDGITTTAKLTAKITKAEVGSDKGLLFSTTILKRLRKLQSLLTVKHMKNGVRMIKKQMLPTT